MNTLIEKIKILRKKTNISFIECKNALLKSNLDVDKAIDYLKKYNTTKITKKNNTLTEGLITSKINTKKNKAVIAEINCETDFVAKNPEFINYCTEITTFFLEKINENNIDVNNNTDLPQELESKKNFLISKFKENIIIKRVKKISIENGFIFGYVHGTNNCGKIASLVTIDNLPENSEQTIKDITMQIVAMNPKYIDVESIPMEILDKEKSIITINTENKHREKNKTILNKIISNNIEKLYNEIILLEQPYIKNQSITIKQLINNKFKILNFLRFELGE